MKNKKKRLRRLLKINEDYKASKKQYKLYKISKTGEKYNEYLKALEVEIKIKEELLCSYFMIILKRGTICLLAMSDEDAYGNPKPFSWEHQVQQITKKHGLVIINEEVSLSSTKYYLADSEHVNTKKVEENENEKK